MKKFLFILFGVFVVIGAFAAGENIPTSKSYVDSKLGEKQDIIPANDGTTARVLTNTGTAGEYGTKGIYDANGAYATQTQNLVDAATMNAGVQNAIDSEFQCIEYDENNECLLMQLGGITQVPAGYTQLKYLESTGTQYIDTGIAPTNTTGLMVKFNRQTNGDQVVVGVLSGNGAGQIDVNPWNGTLTMPFAESYSYGICGQMIDKIDYEVSINYKNNRKRYVNGISVLDISKTLVAHDNTIYMFAGRRVRDNTNIPYYFLKGLIYYLQITEGMNLVRNFIPARRDSDGVLGMYDTVSNTFFTNSGTGEFVAGPMVYLPTGE